MSKLQSRALARVCTHMAGISGHYRELPLNQKSLNALPGIDLARVDVPLRIQFSSVTNRVYFP